MYVRDPRRVTVGGPLAPFAEGFCWEVLGRGYLPRSACQWLQLTAVLSRWLCEQGLEPSDLSEPAIVRFSGDFQNRYRKPMNRRGLDALLIYLRGLGVVPVPVDDAPLGPAALLLADYRRYLIEERALAARSVRRYLPAAAAFIAGLTDLSQAGLARLSAADVTTFVLEQASRRGVADAKSMVSALRSLLRHWFVSGQIEHELWRAVPTVLDRKFRTVPGRLDDGVADVLTASCDRAAGRGRRDYELPRYRGNS